jgi:hypothetical protein
MSFDRALEDQAMDACEQVAEISRWIDCSPANLQRTEQEAFLLRSIKIFEEGGEMVAAIIGMTGQNPRKGVTHTFDDVIDEALDTALTALAFVESATGNVGESLPRLFAKVEKVHARMLAFENGPPAEQVSSNEEIDAYLAKSGLPSLDQLEAQRYRR